MAADARATRRVARVRQLAILCVFMVGTVAIAATSPPMTTVEVPTKKTSVLLDAERPTALTEIVVRINAEATSGSPRNNLRIGVDAVRRSQSDSASPSASGTGSTGSSPDVRFIVTTATPSVLPTPEPSSPAVAPLPTPWQAPLSLGAPRDLPIQCGVGPCERVFWLIAQLTNADAGPVEIEWSVGGRLEYSANAWPSGAAASIEIGQPLLLAGPVAQLTASTAVERLTVGPGNPAAARVVQVQIGAGAIPDDGSPLGTLSVDFIGGQPRPLPAIAIYPLGAASTSTSPSPSLTPTIVPGSDPFAGCLPEQSCTRSFLVTLAWTGNEDREQAFDWQMTVRRVDLVRVWSTPAQLSARLERRFDIAAESASTFHSEGESEAIGPAPSPQIRFGVSTRSAGGNPLAPLLPVPAVIRYSAEIVDPNPPPSNNVASVSGSILAPVPGSSRSAVSFILGNGPTNVVASAMASGSGVCRIAQACPDLEILTRVSHGGQTASTLPLVRFRWSLDLTVYSYTEVPVSMSVEDR